MKTRKATDETPEISLREAYRLSKKAFGIWRRTYPQFFLSVFTGAVAEALIPYAGIYLSARIINELAGERDPQELASLVLISLISAVCLSLLKAVLSRWRDAEGSVTSFYSQKIYTDKLLSMDFCSIDDSHTHDLRSQIAQNARWAEWGLERLMPILNSVMTAIASAAGAGALTVSLFTQRVPETAGALTVLNHPASAFLLLFCLLAVTLLSQFLSNKADSYETRTSADARLANRSFGFYGFMAKDQSRALDIRIYRQDKLCREYNMEKQLFSLGGKMSHYAKGPMGLLQAASAALSVLFMGIVYIFVCLKAWGGAFGVGSVTQYISAVTALAGGIGTLFYWLGDMRNNAVFLRYCFELLEIPNNMYQGSLTVEKRADRNYEIEFRNVSFRYPGLDTWALRHISMKFQVGERLAVVGPNGSGKTTFIKLLCRLYDPVEGMILLNGIDIRKYDYQEYLSLFSVVFQDFKLFAFSLGENVAASNHVNKDRAEQCLKDAGFGGRLKEMERGLETSLYRDFDEKGVNISGGEAQKIAIARALYKDAPFIILDEPTAAFDPIAEYEIYSKFDRLVGDKTAVYISHRLSSCRFCDDIAVFEEGRVVQQGSHDVLVEDMDGKYYELWNAQAQYYTDPNIS